MGRFRTEVTVVLAVLLSGVVGLASSGCRRKHPDGRRDRATGSLMRRSDPYAGAGDVDFHVVHWRICAEPVAGRPNGALGRGALRVLSALRKRRCAVWTAMVGPDRVLIQIPAEGWFHRSLDLVLTAADNGVLVDREAREYWQGRAGRLAAVLEGTGYREPSEENIKFLDDKPVESGNGARKLEAVVERQDDCRRVVEVFATYRPQTSLNPTMLRFLLRAVTLVNGLSLGQKRFEELAKRISGLVTRLRVTSRCVDWPAGRSAVARNAVITGRVETISLPANRAAVPPIEAQRRHGPLSPGPFAYFVPKRLDPLRAWTGKPGPTCPLLISNKSNRSAVVFADGVPLGILSASTTMSFEGLACGYHRLTATSPLGGMSWGPLDTYVAGAWTLR